MRLIVAPVSVLLILLVVAWFARPVVNEILHSAHVSELDLTLLHWFRSHATSAFDSVFVFIALIGSPGALVVVAIVGAIVLARSRRWSLLISWIEAFAGSSILAVGIKHIYVRPRPAGAAEFLHDTSFSFPSTHAVSSLIAFGMTAYLLNMLRPNSGGAKFFAGIVAPLFIFAIGLSRLYLGVHYLSDVLAGFVIGGVWLCVCIVALRSQTTQS